MNKQELSEYMGLKNKETKLWEETKDLVNDNGIWELVRDNISKLIETNLSIEELCNK